MTALKTASRAAATVEEFLGHVTKGNLEGAMGLLDVGVVIDEPTSLPFGGVHTGHDGFLAGVINVLAGIADFHLERFTVLDAGDTAVGRLDMRFTARDSGRTLSTELTEIYEVRDGLITRIDVFYKDTQEFLKLFAAG